MGKIIMHIDVNNAFLSWTAIQLLNQGYKYDIRNSYAVIGGNEKARHGIVLAKSTPAKKMGVVTAETLYSARKKCPSLKTYEPDYNFYQKMSSSLFKLLNKYTPDIEIYSIDECFLDYTPIKSKYGNEIDFAYKIKDEIKEQLGFTVNVGIGNNKLCAKMASDLEKPNKVHTIYMNEVKNKMWPLDINELFGVGKKSTIKLRQLGINSIGDLAKCDVKKIEKYFKNQSKKLIEMALGIDDSLVITKYTEQSSISNETTLDHDVINKEEIYHYLFSLSESVGLRIRKQNKYAYVVAVILKDKYFNRKTHQKKLLNPTNITDEIYKTSKQIYDEMKNEERIRLIGIRLDNLVTEPIHQISLFEDINVRENDTKLDKTIDEIKEKFGSKAINKASLLKNKK